MKRRFIRSIGIAFIILFISGCALPWQSKVTQESQAPARARVGQQVILAIVMPDERRYEFPIEYRDNLSAFDLFTWAGVLTESKDYDFGRFVETIGGVKGENGYFWIYYVNGTTAMQAADKYLVKPGDVIEWRYEAEKAGL